MPMKSQAEEMSFQSGCKSAEDLCSPNVSEKTVAGYVGDLGMAKNISEDLSDQEGECRVSTGQQGKKSFTNTLK